MRVDVEEIFGMEARRRQINLAALSHIEFYQNGKKLDFDLKAIDDFVFTGLSNIHFILTDFQNQIASENGGPEFRPYPPSLLKIQGDSNA